MKCAYNPGAKWLTFCLKNIVKINHEIRNQEYLNDTLQVGNAIIGCNHQSTWETFIFSIILDNFSAVVKKELRSMPIVGLYIKKLECIPIDRSSPVSAIKSLLKFGKLAAENNRNILIFPNGTRSTSNSKTEYKSGIFALYKSLNIPVIPSIVNSGEFWARHTIKKKRGTIILEFKRPILPGLNKSDFFKELEERLATQTEG
jgi:1-acyl-sn-glycerol-3-phosphate acyltransferase